DLAVLRGAARWAIGLPARAVPANDPPWRVEPVSWQVPSGQAGLVRWLVKEGEAYPAHAVLAQVRTADDRVFDLTSGRGGGVMLEHRVEVGGMVVTGAMAATVRVAPDPDRYHVTKRHHLRVAGQWLLTPDHRLLVECSGVGEYVKVRTVASGALVNEL